MYKSLYNLNSKPFELTPDPSFLWLGKNHKEALSVLRDGILDNMGFLLLTGAAGMGKTTLINALTKGLKSNVVWAIISESGHDRLIFYNKIAAGFGIDKKFSSKVQFLIQFSHFLHTAHDNGQQVVLFVDDCHLLNQDMLEELRLLSNIEKADAKLIDIFFIGQPEFNETLVQPKNKAVRERLGLKAELTPLDVSETEDYIRHRLKVSGAVMKFFTARAIEVINHHSGGVPWDINNICEHALRAGSSQGKRIIDHKMVMECVQKLKNPEEMAPEEVQGLQAVEEVIKDATDSQENISRSWLLYTLPLLACFVFALYYFYIKKDTPVAVEPYEAVVKQEVVKQETAVAFIPDAVEVQKIIVKPVVPVIQSEPVEMQPSEEKNEPQMMEATAKTTGNDEVKEVVEVKETTPVIQAKLTSLEEKPVVEEKRAEPEKVILGLQSNSLKLTSKANTIFLDFVDTLLHYPDAKILVKGYVSSDNDTLENIQLSEERAESVRQLLINHGVDAAQIEARGMGIQDPIATNSTSSGRLKNRRVEIEVTQDGS